MDLSIAADTSPVYAPDSCSLQFWAPIDIRAPLPNRFFMGSKYGEGVQKMILASPFTSSATIPFISEARIFASSRVLFIFQLPAAIFCRIVKVGLKIRDQK